MHANKKFLILECDFFIFNFLGIAALKTIICVCLIFLVYHFLANKKGVCE